jgi:hypothetical protein
MSFNATGPVREVHGQLPELREPRAAVAQEGPVVPQGRRTHRRGMSNR